SVLSGILKYNLTESMRGVVNDGMDVLGGRGICLGPLNFLGRTYEAIPISITVEGANILTRSLMIFGQGAIRSHPYVLQEMEAAANPNAEQGLQTFDDLLGRHVQLSLSNAARAMFLGLTGARLVKVPHDGPTTRYYQRLTWASAAFAFVADVTMLSLGGQLKLREK